MSSTLNGPPNGLIRLPNGSRIAPAAIRAIEARSLTRPHIDFGGRAWPAIVMVETRNQVLRVPCASYAEALDMRDAIGARVDDWSERLSRQQERNARLREPEPQPRAFDLAEEALP